jgi:hypothetical protein
MLRSRGGQAQKAQRTRCTRCHALRAQPRAARRGRRVAECPSVASLAGGACLELGLRLALAAQRLLQLRRVHPRRRLDGALGARGQRDCNPERHLRRHLAPRRSRLHVSALGLSAQRPAAGATAHTGAHCARGCTDVLRRHRDGARMRRRVRALLPPKTPAFKTRSARRAQRRACGRNGPYCPPSSASGTSLRKAGTMVTSSSSAQNSTSSCDMLLPCVALLHPVAPVDGPATAVSRGGTLTSPRDMARRAPRRRGGRRRRSKSWRTRGDTGGRRCDDALD